jgi:probable HAF family extracellular repeat protein
MTTREMLTAVALALALSCPGIASAQFNFTTIDVPDSTGTAANANSTHEVVGSFDDADGNTHGFVLSKGTYTQIDVPGASLTIVNGINAKGELVGTYVVGEGLPHTFLLSKGVFTAPLEPLGAIRSQAGTINAQGQVVGTYRDAVQPGRRKGFLWSKGVFTTFNVPGDAPGGTTVFSINERGQIVGSYLGTDGNRHGFVLSDGVYTTIDVPGAVLTAAEAISDAGELVGFFVDADGATHGFLLSKKGVLTQVDVPGATLTEVFGINAKGEIVGVYTDSTGIDHGFIGVRAH